MKKLAYSIIAGLTLLTSTALAKEIDTYVKRDNGISMVCNKKTLGKNYEGDTFYHYREDNSHWVLDKITYLGKGRYKREFVRQVTKKEIPTYTEGIYSLYYDPDQDEENLVAVWKEGIESKVKDAWIELAKKHVKKLNKT